MSLFGSFWPLQGFFSKLNIQLERLCSSIIHIRGIYLLDHWIIWIWNWKINITYVLCSLRCTYTFNLIKMTIFVNYFPWNFFHENFREIDFTEKIYTYIYILPVTLTPPDEILTDNCDVFSWRCVIHAVL